MGGGGGQSCWVPSLIEFNERGCQSPGEIKRGKGFASVGRVRNAEGSSFFISCGSDFATLHSQAGRNFFTSRTFSKKRRERDPKEKRRQVNSAENEKKNVSKEGKLFKLSPKQTMAGSQIEMRRAKMKWCGAKLIGKKKKGGTPDGLSSGQAVPLRMTKRRHNNPSRVTPAHRSSKTILLKQNKFTTHSIGGGRGTVGSTIIRRKRLLVASRGRRFGGENGGPLRLGHESGSSREKGSSFNGSDVTDRRSGSIYFGTGGNRQGG